MANERLNRSIEAIERTIALLERQESGGGLKNADSTALEARIASLEAEKGRVSNELADRDQIIADLRGQVTAQDQSKDEEIAQLRNALEQERSAATHSGNYEARNRALSERCEKLERALRRALSDIDAAVSRTEGAGG